MALCTDDLQTTGLPSHIVQFNIGTTSCHVRGDRHRICLSSLSHNLSLQLVEFRIQHIVGNSLSFQHLAQELRSLNRDGSHQNRLLLLMGFFNFLDNSTVFFFFGHIDRII